MSAMPRVPGAVVAAALLLFFYSGQVLFCVGCAGASMALDPDDEFNKEIERQAPGYRAIDMTSTILSVVTCVAMLGAGAGLLRLMPIAYYITLAVCVIELLRVLAYSIYTGVVVMPIMEEILGGEEMNAPGMPFGDMLNAGIWGQLLTGVFFTFAVMMTVIILLVHPRVRTVFTSDYFEPDERPRQRRRRDYDDEDDGGHGGPPPPPDIRVK